MNSPSRPGHYSAWTKIELGWVDPIEIVLDGEYCAQPVELQPDIYKISHNFPEGEYLLLENRQPIPTDFDERFWEPGGILIYHIGAIGLYRMILPYINVNIRVLAYHISK